jgi:tetratricopeptide (TPR) repeat protein
MSRRAATWSWLLAALALATGCARPQVVRLVEGREVEGRFIDEEAYALFASAAEAEARADLRAAQRLYTAAARADEGSAEILARLGAVMCALGQAPEASFNAAERADPNYEPTHFERARCDLARGGPERALTASERARTLDPDRPETARLRATVLERLGRVDEARRELMAALAREPTSRAAWTAVLELAERHGDRALAQYARAQRATLEARLAAGPRSPDSAAPSLAELDAALGRGEVNEARRLGARWHVSRSELAVRAAALGRAAEARALAESIVRADPADASARIALAAAAELQHDDTTLGVALDAIPAASTPPSPLARLLYAELLARQVDVAAAQAWLGPSATPSAEIDPLLHSVEQRVRAALAP